MDVKEIAEKRKNMDALRRIRKDEKKRIIFFLHICVFLFHVLSFRLFQLFREEDRIWDWVLMGRIWAFS